MFSGFFNLFKKGSKSSFFTKITGVTSDDPISGENRQGLIEKYVKPGGKLYLEHEQDNKYDPNAIKVIWKSGNLKFHLGYLTARRANEVRSHLDKGRKVKVVIKNVTGNDGPKKNLGVNIKVDLL